MVEKLPRFDFAKSITKKYPEDGEIISLYVLPEYIKKGVGHLLFEHGQGSLQELGYTHCVVSTFSVNERAIGFYEKHGYEIVATNDVVSFDGQELPYITMRKRL